MKTLILDGSIHSDPLATPVRDALLSALHVDGVDVEYMRLSEMNIAPCQGDFFCWIRTPGQCAIDDDNRAVTQALIQSDLVIYLTPVTFGGYSAELKRAVDHLIPLVSPFFAMEKGEIHHQRRYRRYPRLMVIGWLPQPDEASEGIFHHLVYRNGINMYAPSVVSGVVYAGTDEADIHRAIRGWLDAAQGSKRQPEAALPAVETPAAAASYALQSAVLLVGSPRGKTSTSNALGSYLFEQLAARGVQTETIRLYTVLKSEQNMQALLEAVSAAGLVTLAFPLYVDALPGAVVQVLEKIAAYRRENPPDHPQQLAAIANCGFPEAAQNDTALAICHNFSRLAGFEWAGGLSLGGGEGIVHGTPLGELDGRATPIKASLELAAHALAAGEPIPAQPVALMSRKVIPAWLYRIMGAYGWKQQAKGYGTQKKLNEQPYRQA